MKKLFFLTLLLASPYAFQTLSALDETESLDPEVELKILQMYQELAELTQKAEKNLEEKHSIANKILLSVDFNKYIEECNNAINPDQCQITLNEFNRGVQIKEMAIQIFQANIETIKSNLKEKYAHELEIVERIEHQATLKKMKQQAAFEKLQQQAVQKEINSANTRLLKQEQKNKEKKPEPKHRRKLNLNAGL